MADLEKKDRDLVVPGEEIVKSMEYLPGRYCFREGESIIAKKVGLVSIDHHVVSVVPLNAPYIPKEGDMVIGEVIDLQHNGWVVWADAPHDAFLPLSGVREYIDTRRTQLSRYYDIGDTLYAKVQGTQGRSIYLSMQDPKCKKLRGGRLIRINPAKVPRLIGKQGSMIGLIKDRTGCRIHIGQNGRVWLEGEGAEQCIKAIRMVEEEAASEGLTDRIAHMLGGGPAPRLPQPAEQPAEDAAEERAEEMMEDE